MPEQILETLAEVVNTIGKYAYILPIAMTGLFVYTCYVVKKMDNPERIFQKDYDQVLEANVGSVGKISTRQQRTFDEELIRGTDLKLTGLIRDKVPVHKDGTPATFPELIDLVEKYKIN